MTAGTQFARRGVTRRRTVTGYDPGAISNLSARYRADQTGGTSGAGIASWPDLSPNAYTASQATSGQQPKWYPNVFGSQPSVRFTAANSMYMTSGAPSGNQAQTIAAVIRTGPSVSGTYTIRGAASTNGLQLRINSGTVDLIAQFTAAIVSSSSAVTASATYIIVAAYDGSTGAYSFRFNGTTAGSGTTSTRSFAASGSTIGQNATGNSEYFDGDIGELLLFNRALTSTEIQTVDSYVADRYGITVTDHL